MLHAEFCENLLQNAGVRFAGPIAILRNWTFCLFYVMAELWGSVVVSLLFWGFANQVRFSCEPWTKSALPYCARHVQRLPCLTLLWTGCFSQPQAGGHC